MARKFITLILVVLLALAAVLLVDRPTLAPTTDQTPAKATPGAILTQATTRQYDANGRLQYLLKVERAEQFFRFNNQNKPLNVNQGYTDLTKPDLTVFNENNENPWQLSADFGKTENNGKQIQLWGNVVAQKALPSGGKYKITTSKLMVLPLLQRASTEQPVSVTSPEGSGDSVGMDIDMPEQIIKLNSQVNAIYEPN